MTLLPEETRREQISAALEAHKPEQHESANVPWKGGSEICPVVKVSLNAAALNHKSHRIRAELESHPDAEEIKADPFSQKPQDLVADILRGTDGFEPLKEDLDGEEGQRDYGIITEAGLLVNANTRAVALRDLGVRHIKVAVLPGGATEQEIADLELRLQMQRDFKQEYTFTNELLFVEDLISTYGYSQTDVAKAIRRSEREVEQFTRLLALIRGVQVRSGNKIPLTFFDEEKKGQILIELDQAYEKKRARDPEAARGMRDARILALLAGNAYRDIRQVDESFPEAYLLDALKEQEELGDEIAIFVEMGPPSRCSWGRRSARADAVPGRRGTAFPGLRGCGRRISAIVRPNATASRLTRTTAPRWRTHLSKPVHLPRGPNQRRPLSRVSRMSWVARWTQRRVGPTFPSSSNWWPRVTMRTTSSCPLRMAGARSRETSWSK